MKRKYFLFIVLILAVSIFKNGYAQQMLFTVSQIDSFPSLPNDTAFEGQPYNFQLVVSNISPSPGAVDDTLKVILRNSDTVAAPAPEILASFYIDSLFGNDTFHIAINNYLFTQSTYKAGNNIVVVWPRLVNTIGATYDSLSLDVYFVILQSVNNMLHVNNASLSVFPNPAVHEIGFDYLDKNSIEYVRIINSIGQEILLSRSPVRKLNVEFLSEGFYFIEIKNRSGTFLRKKFLKL